MNAQNEQQQSRWQRFLNRLAAVDDALNTSYDELQDRRIARLEGDLDELRMQLAANNGFLTK